MHDGSPARQRVPIHGIQDRLRNRLEQVLRFLSPSRQRRDLFSNVRHPLQDQVPTGLLRHRTAYPSPYQLPRNLSA
jgi:hypothetical protein